MTDVAHTSTAAGGVYQSPAFAKRLQRRYAAEQRFRLYGMAAVTVAIVMLLVLLGSILSTGYTAFVQANIRLEIAFDPEVIDPSGRRDPIELDSANYLALVNGALRARFPEVTQREDQRRLYTLVSNAADLVLRQMVANNPDLIGTKQQLWLPTSSDVDQLMKGIIRRDVAEGARPISDQQIAWIDKLKADNDLATKFNTAFFTRADSREPELAGIWGALVGSFLTLLVTLSVSFPIGVAAAIYLEEFAPKNRLTDIIEVNINNLAAVPSIVYGLLGLAMFLNFFGLPRSAPLVGGMVLALMTLPIIIIAGRAALKAVPPSIREAALGVGASPLQTVMHHVLPLAMPGMLTGTILGMAHALGETAPLLLIGMVAFIVSVPGSFTDSATVLPVQIFIWADSPERGFVEKTSGAIIVLLVFLILMNAVAVYLRKKFERRW